MQLETQLLVIHGLQRSSSCIQSVVSWRICPLRVVVVLNGLLQYVVVVKDAT